MEYKTIYNNFEYLGNNLIVRRDDLYPFSFGGNKALKAEIFFKDILRLNFDTVVTYGSDSSNHCRIVANLCANKKIDCIIISPKENKEENFNNLLIGRFGAKKTYVKIVDVSSAIDKTMKDLKENGKKPYFIPGGGHGNLGTQAYVNVFYEICQYEKDNNIKLDYIFLASGTGTTQAGLEVGKQLCNSRVEIYGISIARKEEYGKEVIYKSISEYFESQKIEMGANKINFNDDYLCGGYGKYDAEIIMIIEKIMTQYGIPLDTCYTGKAFLGMTKLIERLSLKNKNILFIHTGGTPIYFDYLNRGDKL